MLGYSYQEVPRTVAVNYVLADVQRRSLQRIAVIVFHNPLHQVFGDGESLTLRRHHAAESIQIGAGAKGIAQVAVRSHV